jgi:hypothetical protein
MADSPMTPLRSARHTLRGKMNLLKLCATVLPTCETPDEMLEYLSELEKGADTLLIALDDYERLLDEEGSKQP